MPTLPLVLTTLILQYVVHDASSDQIEVLPFLSRLRPDCYGTDRSLYKATIVVRRSAGMCLLAQNLVEFPTLNRSKLSATAAVTSQLH